MKTRIISTALTITLFILLSCGSVKHKRESTGFTSNEIQTHYCIEVLDEKKDSTTMVKIHSHSTGEVYLIESTKINEIIEYDLSKQKADTIQ